MSIKVVVPIENSDSTVTRLVVKSIIEQLMYATEMPELKEIMYIQRGGQAAQAQTNHTGEALKLEVENHIQVEYKETHWENEFDITKYQNEYPPIFNASALGISIVPMHTKTQLEMTFTYRSKSYATLTNWLNAFNRRLQYAQAMDFHDVQYNYTIPDDVLAYLYQAYAMTEAVAGYGITLGQFMENHFCKNGVVIRQNLDDSQRAIAINVKNTGCVGLFTQIPDIQETSKEPPLSEVSFTYMLNYDRISAVLLEYQLYIHNQIVDLVYLRKYEDRRYHNNQHAGIRTFSQSVNAVTENAYGVLDHPDDGTNTGDGWVPAINPPSTYTSKVIPIQLDLTNLADILDLNLLTEVGYPDWLVGVMRQYSDKLCTFKTWVINIELFEVNAETVKVPVYVDANFHLRTNLTLNPRNRYYIRILVLTDLLRIDFSALQRDPSLLLRLLQWINPKVTLTTIGNGSYVTDASLWAALNLINNSDLKFLNTLTVETANIIVRRNP